MQVTPYLMLDGRAQEAIDFYRQAVGATVGMLMRFKEAPEGSCAPGSEEKVMHASITVGSSVLMLTDGYNKGNPEFKGISLSLSADDEAQADTLFAALSAGGKVDVPMNKTFFARKFAVVTDKFGVSWMIIAE